MSLGQHPVLLVSGVALLLVAFVLWRIASRWDLKGMAVDAAWQLARRRQLDADSDLSRHWRELSADVSRRSQAKRVAGHAVRHFAAQVMTIAALVLALLGMAAIAFAVFWN